MKGFVAKNPKQLDICLRMLYADGHPFTVHIRENDKRKIEYYIVATTDDETIAKLRERYRILIS